jgi:hypothetical protein
MCLAWLLGKMVRGLRRRKYRKHGDNEEAGDDAYHVRHEKQRHWQEKTDSVVKWVSWAAVLSILISL